MRLTPKFAEYLHILNLTLVTDMVQKREAGPLLPPKEKHKKVSLVVFEKLKGSAWGATLHNEDPKEKMKETTQPNSRQT